MPNTTVPEAWQQLGARIRAERKWQRLTRGQLAERCGISENTIANVELGHTTPRPQSLGAISRGLGWGPGSVEAILAGGEPTPMPNAPQIAAQAAPAASAACGLPRAAIAATRYEVSILPEGDVNRRYHTLSVTYWGDGQWAVTHLDMASLGADGTWSDGIKPYGREGWWDAHRFDLATALRLAEVAAPDVAVNGVTAAEAYRRTHATEATP